MKKIGKKPSKPKENSAELEIAPLSGSESEEQSDEEELQGESYQRKTKSGNVQAKTS